ncbi:MAG: NAD(P)H-dependent oxidoreductase [bacterium]|nr:NAD(P)H-dependent oxidoreductase [bacterium]
MADALKLKVILGSTRPGRFSEKASAWIMELLKNHTEFDTEVLDLRDYPMPYYEEAGSPSQIKLGADHGKDVVNAWARKIEEADVYLIITPEYNHGYSAVLKNAMDYIYAPWNNKAVAFLSYGSVGGGRSVEQLREVAVELQMAPIRQAVHIQAPWMLRDEKGELKAGVLDSYKDSAEGMLKQLAWWAQILKVGRATV